MQLSPTLDPRLVSKVIRLGLTLVTPAISAEQPDHRRKPCSPPIVSPCPSWPIIPGFITPGTDSSARRCRASHLQACLGRCPHLLISPANHYLSASTSELSTAQKSALCQEPTGVPDKRRVQDVQSADCADGTDFGEQNRNDTWHSGFNILVTE